jgi:type I restriction enzyme R subunit
MSDYKTIAESNNFIVLDNYTKDWQVNESYQSEADLEHELIRDLESQGYEYVAGLNAPEKMLVNVRHQIQTLNKVTFLDAEWQRFVAQYLDTPSDHAIDKTRKIHDDYIYDFVFDDGHIENVYLLDKSNLLRNKLQVIKQFEQTGTQANRYDVTILVNGLPLVQIELKKRGVAIREAFNQVHRYSKESFNSDNSLFKYLQIFVINSMITASQPSQRCRENTTKMRKMTLIEICVAMSKCYITKLVSDCRPVCSLLSPRKILSPSYPIWLSPSLFVGQLSTHRFGLKKVAFLC